MPAINAIRFGRFVLIAIAAMSVASVSIATFVENLTGHTIAYAFALIVLNAIKDTPKMNKSSMTLIMTTMQPSIHLPPGLSMFARNATKREKERQNEPNN